MGSILNVMLIVMLKKLAKSKSNLISTNMKMINFTCDMTTAIRVLVVDITMAPKTLNSAFFMVDVKFIYSMLLGRDWIHSS